MAFVYGVYVNRLIITGTRFFRLIASFASRLAQCELRACGHRQERQTAVTLCSYLKQVKSQPLLPWQKCRRNFFRPKKHQDTCNWYASLEGPPSLQTPMSFGIRTISHILDSDTIRQSSVALSCSSQHHFHIAIFFTARFTPVQDMALKTCSRVGNGDKLPHVPALEAKKSSCNSTRRYRKK